MQYKCQTKVVIMRTENEDKQTNDRLMSEINLEAVPRHVAIIMDGNGRWARDRNLPRIAGHKQGIEVVKDIVSFCTEIKISALTLYAFSTENWNRPLGEVNFLLNLPYQYLETELPRLIDENVRIVVSGETGRLPRKARRAIARAAGETSENTGMFLNLAINYGSRSEILRAVAHIAEQVSQGELRVEEIDEKIFSRHLYNAELGDPDLLIRSGGELRISNFLLWQLAYSELWFTSAHWPDFSRAHLLQAIIDYQKRQRRFGSVLS